MKQLLLNRKALLISCTMMLASLFAKAGIEHLITSRSGSAIVNATGAAPSLLQQDLYYPVTGLLTSPLTSSIGNVVTLRYDDSKRTYDALPWALDVTYDLKLYPLAGGSPVTYSSQHLIISFDPATSYTDKDVKVYSDGMKAELFITNVAYSVNGGSPTAVPSSRNNDIYLDLEQKTDRCWAGMDTIAPVVVVGSVTTAHELPVAWEYIRGAESYQLEWLFIDAGSGSITGNYDYDFRNATRITTTNQYYNIPLAYPKGILLYRVRGEGITCSSGALLESLWSVSSSALAGNTSSLTSSNAFRLNYTGLDTTYNWQYSAAYAEEGKRKEMISYFDGSLRNRQSVTVVNSDNRTVVGETKYDFEGRAAVQLLPTPFENQGIKFYQNFNPNFDKNDFDTDGNFSAPAALTTPDQTGKFYSSGNPDLITNNYVPDAEGYAYTRTLFKQDGTSRPTSQAGAGVNYKIGSGHETRFFYATPTQVEIDRLFGNEVGYASHYKKNMVQDANGQVSISYLDQEGRTIATALAGAAPANLLDIDLKPKMDTVSTDLLDGENHISGDAVTAQSTIAVSSPGVYTFEYDLTSTCYGETTPCPIACADCKYDLFIEVKQTDSGIHPALTFSTQTPALTGSPNPVILTNVAAADYHFTASLSVGTYEITKRLVLNLTDLPLSTLIASLENPKNRACLNVAEVPVETCLDCTTLCEQQYTATVDDETVYLDDDGNVVTDPEQITAIQALLAQCIQICNNPATSPAQDPCLQKKILLSADVSPGGQYFDNLNIANSFTSTTLTQDDWLHTIEADGAGFNAWFLASPLNYTGYAGPTTLSSWNDVRNNWDDAWGEIMFLNYHPEECAWEYNCEHALCGSLDMSNSNDYDKGLEADAAALGAYCNPTAIPVSTSVTPANMQYYNDVLSSSATQITDPYVTNVFGGNNFCKPDPIIFSSCEAPHDTINRRSAINSLLQHYVIASEPTDPIVYMSIWYVLADPAGIHLAASAAAATTAAGTPISNHVYEYFKALHGDGGTNYGLFGGGTPITSKYRYFRNAYEAAKKMIQYQGQKNHCSTLPLAHATGSPGFTSDGFAIRYPGVDSYDQFLSSVCPSGNPNRLEFTDPSAYLTLVGDYTSPATNTDMAATCHSNCEGYADGWRHDLLASCPSIDSTDLDEMINYMVEICAASCNTTNPHGLDNTSPGISGPKGTLSTFAAVIAAYTPPCASGTTIVHPPDTTYNQATCTCENLHAFITSITIDSIGAPSNQDIADALNDAYNPSTAITDSDVAALLAECASESPSMGDLTEIPTEMQCPASQYPDPNDACDLFTQQAEADAAFTYQQNLDAAALARAQSYIAAYKANCIASLLGREAFSMVYQLNEYYYTLYYYDQAGNLIKTVPPNGVAILSPATTPSLSTVAAYRLSPVGTLPVPNHTMITHYKYNSLQQLVYQATPDAGLSIFGYDQLGRLVLSQNSKQAGYSPLGYSYTIYDALGRVSEVGEVKTSTAPVDITLTTPSLFTAWLATGTKEQITRTYYDEPLSGVSAYFGTAGQENLRNRVASVAYFETDVTNYDRATHYSYDIHGNVETLIQENKSLAAVNTSSHYDLKYIDYEYDLISGNVNKVSYQARLDDHGNPQPDRFYHRYYYDGDNRLTETYTSHDGQVWEKEAKNFYYSYGPLARAEIGDKEVQANDYVYTIQGWIKGVNSNTLASYRDVGKDAEAQLPDTYTKNENANFGSDAMGYTLGYFNGDYKSIGSAFTGLNNFEASNTAGDFYDATTPGLYNGNIRDVVNVFMDINEAPVDVYGRVYQYDQLNRIRNAHTYMDGSVIASNNMGILTHISRYDETFHYDLNGNILKAGRNGNDDAALKMDSLTYFYWNRPGTGIYSLTGGSAAAPANATNKLAYVSDGISSPGDIDGRYTTDIDNETNSDNYQYDSIGNLIVDKSEDIANIEWTVYGKIKSITRTSGSNKDELEFKYDASGNRVEKIVKPRTGGTLQDQSKWKYTYYVRDAAGNVMAVYDRNFVPITGGYNDIYELGEQDIYGSSRLGLFDNRIVGNITMPLSSFTASISGGVFTSQSYTQPSYTSPCTSNCVYSYSRTLGQKEYELSNYLGNVIATVSDRKLQVDDLNYTASAGGGFVFDAKFNNFIAAASGTTHTQSVGADGRVDRYLPDVLSSQDYYAFGAPMPGRGFTSSISYRYGGAGGQERDDEIYGAGNAYTAAFWEYDPRLGRRWNIDPVIKPFESSYATFGNCPTRLIDPTGKDPDDYVFNEKGNYVRTDKTDKPDQLVVEDSKTKVRTEYKFNDPKTDVAQIKYNIAKLGEDVDITKLLFVLPEKRIDDMMKKSGVEPMNYLERRYFTATESKAGKMDFTVWHLSQEIAKGANGTWDYDTELATDKGGPIFIIANEKTVYNLHDAGNWLWGNAVNRLGGSSTDARNWSLWNDPKDSQADQRAIQNGWFYQAGFRNSDICPANK